MKNHLGYICKIRLFAILVTLLSSVIFCTGNNIFRTLNTSDGLPDNYILGITSDEEGYIYIATKKGICRHDGHKTISITDSAILTNPRLAWLASLNHKQHRSTIKTFVDRSGRVWIYDIYGHGLECHKTGRRYFNKTIIKDIAEDSLGNLWLATNNEGLAILNVETSEYDVLAHSTSDKYSIPSNHLTCIHIDSVSQSVWIGTSESGVGITSVKAPDITYESLDIPHDVSSFAFLPDGNFIIAFDGGGIFSSTKSVPGIPSKIITNILYDKENKGLFIATYGSGLFYVKDNKCKQLDGCGASSAVAFSRQLMIDSKGCLWIGTFSDGLFRRSPDGSLMQFTSEKSGFGSDCIVGLGQKGDTIYYASTFAACKMTLDNLTPEPIDVSEPAEIHSFTIGNNGDIWIAGKNIIRTPQNEHIAIPDIKAIATDNSGRCWITGSAGLFCIEPRHSDIGICRLLQFSSHLGIDPASFSKYSLRCSPGGMMFAGTFGGYLKFNPESLVDISPSKIHLSGIDISGKESQSGKIHVLEPGDTLNISLTSLGYLFPENDKYAWRILPDSTLHYASGSDIVITDIQPGKHILQIVDLKTDQTIDIELVQKRSLKWLWYVAAILLIAVVIGFVVYRTYFIKKHRADIDNMMPAEKEFLIRIEEIINEEIGNQEFSIEDFATRMNMSRSSLYKKFISTTGRSPLEYLRDKRIEKGKQLLDEGHNVISQVAYSVGLSPKQFARFFKEAYGTLPSDYIRK